MLQQQRSELKHILHHKQTLYDNAELFSDYKQWAKYVLCQYSILDDTPADNNFLNTLNINSKHANIQTDLRNGSFSIPSPLHPNRNEDCIKTINGNHNTAVAFDFITIVCDGVSNCGFDTAGNPVNGLAASTMITHGFADYCTTSTFNAQLTALTSQITNTTFVDLFYNQLLAKLKEISQSINPPQSATTVALTIEISINKKKYLLAITIGDSQTVCVYPNQQGIYTCKQLSPQAKKFRSFYDPGGVVSANRIVNAHWSCVEQLPNNTTVITFTDGIGDAICELNNHDQARLDAALFCQLVQFCQLNAMTDFEIAQFLTAYSIMITPKPDDIAIHCRQL